MRYKLLLLSLPVFLTGLAVPAMAGGADSPAADDQNPFAQDLESLLNTKVTTASKFSEKLSDAPGVMSVVTKDELKRFGGITLREILDRVPGLSGSVASFTDRSIVAARGDQTKINGGHILFLINGRPTREVLEGGLAGDLLESFPVSVLERIEVIKGPGSVLYGSNAYSAVINLITQKAEGNELVVTGMGGQGAAAAVSGEFMLQRGSFSMVGASQFHQRPTWGTNYWSPIFGLQNALAPDRSQGSYIGVNYKGFSAMSSFTEWTSGYTEGGAGVGRWRRGFADVGYRFQANSKWEMSFDLTYTKATLDATHYIPFIDRVSQEVVGEWTSVLTLTDRDQITFGALYNYNQGIENFYFNGPMPISDGSRGGEAAYVQIDHALLENVQIIGGVQANKIGSLSLSVVPRGGLIWNPVSHIGIKALYSEAYRAPSINETSINYIPPPEIGGPSLHGDPKMRPERVSTVDLGITYQADHFLAAVDGFYSKQTDNIILINPMVAASYANVGNTIFRGVELEGKYYLGKHFFFQAAGLYQTSRDADGNRKVTPIPTFGMKGGISYECPGNLSVSLFDIHEGSLSGYATAVNPQPGAYDLLNANVRYDLSKYLPSGGRTGMALVAHGENLTNKAVWLPDWRDTPGDTTFANRGRTLYFGIEVFLKKD